MSLSSDAERLIDAHVAASLRRHRIAAGLTQADLASLLSLSYQQLQKYETGTNRISAGRLYELSQILSVDISSFFAGVDSPPAPWKPRHGGASRPTIELVNNFDTIEDREIRMVISHLVRALSHRGEKSND